MIIYSSDIWYNWKNFNAFGFGLKIYLEFKIKRDAAWKNKHYSQNYEIGEVLRGIVNFKIVGKNLSKNEAKED